jgi:hypothetical protein
MKITYIYPDNKKPEGAPEEHADTMRRSVEQPHGPGSPVITMVSNNKIVAQDEDDVLKNPHRYSAEDVLKHQKDINNRKVH